MTGESGHGGVNIGLFRVAIRMPRDVKLPDLQPYEIILRPDARCA